jgi:hypothetical protein
MKLTSRGHNMCPSLEARAVGWIKLHPKPVPDFFPTRFALTDIFLFHDCTPRASRTWLCGVYITQRTKKPSFIILAICHGMILFFVVTSSALLFFLTQNNRSKSQAYKKESHEAQKDSESYWVLHISKI